MTRTTLEIDEEIDKIANRIMAEIETASSNDLSKVGYAKRILQLSDLHYTTKLLEEIESASAGSVASIEKRAVIKALLLSTWMQRLYFIIRTFFMSVIGALITFGYIVYFGKIDLFLGIVLGIIVFFFTLIITRLFDAHIVKATKITVRGLSRHEAIRDFIMNHL